MPLKSFGKSTSVLVLIVTLLANIGLFVYDRVLNKEPVMER